VSCGIMAGARSPCVGPDAGTNGRVTRFRSGMVAQGWDMHVTRSAADFRRQAEECRCLATRLKLPEHRSFALSLARSWTELAERAEAKEAAAKPRKAVLCVLVTQVGRTG
jgi:hypothetical protein